MAAKGSIAKQEITNKILEVFPNSFTYDKEIRIPYTEEGEQIQIKCTLTCAKTNVEMNGDIAIPGEDVKTVSKAEVTEPVKPTAQEKANVRRLMDSLGI